MARAYSLDLRERVVAMVARGGTCRSVAAVSEVSVASVVKWSQRARTTGSVAAKGMGGQRPYLLEGERSFLLGRLAEKPDLTLHFPNCASAASPCPATLCGVFCAARGSASKKTLFAGEQDRPDVARRRTLWKKIQLRLDPRRLVFIDETWAKTNMTRAHGWNRRGEALIAKAPQGSLENDDIPRRLAMRRNHGALRARRADQRRKLFGLCRAGSCADFEAWRHRRHGQSRLP